ncbi:MAG TPA: PhnD/SsuA/transferrin family substrate-binding protein [Burkholderiales bacterium]|nr:PhnD/SsuA/transferrin family substrate-binding protein [Burkholderiales bacterium]
MSFTLRRNLTRRLLQLVLAPALTAFFASFAQGQSASTNIVFAINEGGSGNLDAADTLFKYQELGEVVEKALRVKVSIVNARGRDRLKENLKNHSYGLLLARPNDVPAEAVRDFGYQPVVSAKEPYQTLFIVVKTSPIRTISDVRGRTILTPDQYSNMWRAANAMLRDNKIDMSRESVKSMRDQAAIGWSLENGFFDVGVVNSVSGVGRSWEKNGGRVIARSPDQINMPLIASPKVSAAQIERLRAAIIALESTESGHAILKKIGMPAGFKETPRQAYLDFLAWLGDLDIKQP